MTHRGRKVPIPDLRRQYGHRPRCVKRVVHVSEAALTSPSPGAVNVRVSRASSHPRSGGVRPVRARRRRRGPIARNLATAPPREAGARASSAGAVAGGSNRPGQPDGGHRPDLSGGRPADRHTRALLRGADLRAGGHVVHRRTLAARHLPPRADQHRPRRRGGHRAREGRGAALTEPLPRAPRLRRRDGRKSAPRAALRRGAGHRQDTPRQGDGPRGRRPLPVRVRHVLPVDVLRGHGAQDPLVLQGAAQGSSA